MKRILFVDDNPDTLQEFKEMLRPMRLEWGMSFVSSGKEALNFMSKFPFDVVVSDLHMPEMNGAKLLYDVSERYPETVRIILSEPSDRDSTLESVKYTHQSLMKPCDFETIKYTIERTLNLQKSLKNEDLIKIVTGIKELPSLPQLYGLIVKEMQSPDASLKKVGYIIAHDASMSAKILQIVNSAYFSLPQKITDPQQAAVFLGIDTLKALVLSIHAFSSLTVDESSLGLPLVDIMKHSLMVSKVAREIVKVNLDDKKIMEEALIGGILHDIGKLILMKLPDQCKRIKHYIEQTGNSFTEVEYAVMKTSHAELGAYLLGLWGLPDNVVETVAFHHNPSKLLGHKPGKQNNASGKAVFGQESGKTDLLPQSDIDNSMCIPSQLRQEFAALTAVHVANALAMQGDRSQDTTTFPYIDMAYLEALDLVDMLPEWAEYYNNVTQKTLYGFAKK